jgi:putative phosphoesterase
MRILIVSDSHGNNGPLKTAIEKERPDILIHLGDSEYSQSEISGWAGAPKTPCVFLKGNCDVYHNDSAPVRDVAVFELNGHRFYCTHGHLQHVNYGLLTLSLYARENDCDICLFGHTHVPYDSFGDAVSDFSRFYDNGPCDTSGPRILNPGSISLPRGGSKRGYMIMEMAEDGRYDVKYCLI